jgi:hypothetical protein
VAFAQPVRFCQRGEVAVRSPSTCAGRPGNTIQEKKRGMRQTDEKPRNQPCSISCPWPQAASPSSRSCRRPFRALPSFPNCQTSPLRTPPLPDEAYVTGKKPTVSQSNSSLWRIGQKLKGESESWAPIGCEAQRTGDDGKTNESDGAGDDDKKSRARLCRRRATDHLNVNVAIASVSIAFSLEQLRSCADR